MPHFLCRLASPRTSFPADMNAQEAAAMAEHGAYWQAEADAGRAVAVGPVFDPAGAWGLAIVEVTDEAEVRALLQADPVVTAGLGFSYSFHPMPMLIQRGPRPAH